ncbi:MAG: hypothetical protein Q8R45_10425 [Brevundimonas sp.]|uniref:hypothetical protein n=1 Tax=Brevundimonas sp. TaxID=1871086 RepID=UPI002732995D|nr:hypothetical protein [Brevundimonas sp.]MDP3657364.1 hypothetical protein [Brevundimonas sp.]MDZ4111921.1 hypothetical protein [Brevundimonas sp.]
MLAGLEGHALKPDAAQVFGRAPGGLAQLADDDDAEWLDQHGDGGEGAAGHALDVVDLADEALFDAVGRLLEAGDQGTAAALAGKGGVGDGQEEGRLFGIALLGAQPADASRDRGEIDLLDVGGGQIAQFLGIEFDLAGHVQDAADDPEADMGEGLELEHLLQMAGDPKGPSVRGDEGIRRRREGVRLRRYRGRFGSRGLQRMGPVDLGGEDAAAAEAGDLQHVDGLGRVPAEEMGHQIAQILQAGHLGAEFAERGLNQEIVGRRHPLEEATALEMARERAFDVVVDLFLAAVPSVPEALGDGVQTDQIDPAFLQHARRLKALKRRSELVSREALDARAFLHPVGDNGTGHEDIHSWPDYFLMKLPCRQDRIFAAHLRFFPGPRPSPGSVNPGPACPPAIRSADQGKPLVFGQDRDAVLEGIGHLGAGAGAGDEIVRLL